MNLINQQLPAIPSKRYFTISEASNLCEVKGIKRKGDAIEEIGRAHV